MELNNNAAAENEQKMDPTQIILSSQEAYAVINKTPKAQHHFLVFPKNDIGIFEIQYKHLPLLKNMLQLAKNVIAEKDLKEKDFIFGFKLYAHEKNLAMHVVSNDFVSEHLLTKHHWNTFHTRIFMPYVGAFGTLKVHGVIDPLEPARLEAMLESTIRCNQCDFITVSMGFLKVHLANHWQTNITKETSSPIPERTQKQTELDTAPVSTSSVASSAEESTSISSLMEMMKKLLAAQKEETEPSDTSTITSEQKTLLNPTPTNAIAPNDNQIFQLNEEQQMRYMQSLLQVHTPQFSYPYQQRQNYPAQPFPQLNYQHTMPSSRYYWPHYQQKRQYYRHQDPNQIYRFQRSNEWPQQGWHFTTREPTIKINSLPPGNNEKPTAVENPISDKSNQKYYSNQKKPYKKKYKYKRNENGQVPNKDK